MANIINFHEAGRRLIWPWIKRGHQETKRQGQGWNERNTMKYLKLAEAFEKISRKHQIESEAIQAAAPEYAKYLMLRAGICDDNAIAIRSALTSDPIQPKEENHV